LDENIERVLHRENLTLASIRKRALAFVIDETLLSFLLIIALFDTFQNAASMEEIINVTNSFVLEYVFVKIVYQAFFTMRYGASIGKILMKIRVIEIQTLSNPSVLRSLNRAIFRILSEMFFYLGFLWGAMQPSRQTWHDKTAKTLVIDA
jgi:uncharacterized RDD family membrane protein YckC